MKRKGLFTSLLALCFVVGMLVFPVSAATDSGTYGDNITWTYDADTKTITFSGTGILTAQPGSSQEGYVKYCVDVRHIVVAEGFTAIAENSFPRGVFYDVESIRIADSVEKIGEYAFANYFKLKQLHLGKGVKTIEEAAFMSCEQLESLTLPAGLEKIGMEAFSLCGIKTLVIPEGITVIENSAFRVAQNLVSVSVPTSVTKIEYAAFKSCDKLTDVYYAGTRTQWEAIVVDNSVDETGGSNADLLDATIHYNHTDSWKEVTTETQPTTPTEPITPEAQPTTPTQPSTPTQPTTQPTTQPNEEQTVTTVPAEVQKPAVTDPAPTQPTEVAGGEEIPATFPGIKIGMGVAVLIVAVGVVVFLRVRKKQ